MMAHPIQFFEEDCIFKLSNKTLIRAWLKQVITTQRYQLEALNFIFCSDEYLWRLNRSFLRHNTYTDVITFDNAENKRSVSGDVFISVERARDNAKSLGHGTTTELYRVIIHGTLHLLGYKDKLEQDKILMRKQEDFFLARLYYLADQSLNRVHRHIDPIPSKDQPITY